METHNKHFTSPKYNINISTISLSLSSTLISLLKLSICYKTFSFRKFYIKNVKPDPVISERQDEERALAGDALGPADPQYCSWERGWCCQR